MKKIYLLSSALMLSVASFAQLGHGYIAGTKPAIITNTGIGERISFPDTTGIGLNIITDFLPQYNPSGGANLIFGYTGGGYVYGNNASTLLRVVAQGYKNLNSAPVKVTDVMAIFVAKQSDAGSSATSKVTFKAYGMAPNRACNQAGGTYNLTTLNFDGPVAAVSASQDLLFSDIDTGQVVGYNIVTFASPASFSGDFAIACDFTPLAVGDTAGFLCDPIGDAADLDYAYHYVGGSYNKWMCTDNIFSATGTGDVNNDIAIFAILADATGVNEFFNGMKLTTYPNPTTDHATIEYTLEKNSNGVSLVVYDAHGHKVVNNNYSNQSAGTYKVEVDAQNLAAGTYYYQLKANGTNFTKKFVVTK